MDKHPAYYKIIEQLNQAGVQYKLIEHPPTYTSEESALARGEPLVYGGKSLLMKVNKSFKLFVLPAHKKIDSLAIRKAFATRKLRFASTDELKELTQGLVSGCIPPFGEPILPFELYVDKGVLEIPIIAFNAASLTDSIVLEKDDYLRVANYENSFAFSVD